MQLQFEYEIEGFLCDVTVGAFYEDPSIGILFGPQYIKVIDPQTDQIVEISDHIALQITELAVEIYKANTEPLF